MWFAILLVTAGVVCAAEPSPTRKRYDGYKVLNVIPVNKEALALLQHLMLTDVNIDFWKEPSRVGSEVHMMIPPEHLSRIERILNEASIDYKLHVQDVQSQLTQFWNSLESRSRNRADRAINLDDYNSVETINDWLPTLVGNCRVGLTCELYNAGNSFENRPIYVFKISKPGSGRKAIWIDATTHAREWISTATVVKILNHLATSGDDSAVSLTDQYDWYIMPVVNPDGYSYSWTNDRLWRKNRRTNPGLFCYGVDLNRNFDFRWASEGVGFNPCGEMYGGESGNSEPETVAVVSELTRLAPNLLVVLTFHSYGSDYLMPWGNTIDFAGAVCERPDDYDELLTVATAAADATQATYGSAWRPVNSCEAYYPVTGSTQDYAKGVTGIKYTFTPELRGDSFTIDNSNIPQSFNEIWNGIVALCNAISA